MPSIFQPYLDKFVLIFIDGILIYYKNQEEHEKNLKIVLHILRDNQLYAKYRKCNYFKN